MSATVTIKGLDVAVKTLDPKRYREQANKALNRFGMNVDRDAKLNAPTDEGHIKQSVFFSPGDLTVKVGCTANYAAYMEFGTRGFAAQYVATLPKEFQELAEQHRGKGGGSFEELVKALTEWVERKGIVATFSIKTHAQLKNSDSTVRAKQAAYLIARSILIKGVKPQPFLYPAVNKNMKQLLDELK